MPQLSTLLIVVFAALVSAGLAVLVAGAFFSARMRDLNARLEKTDKARAHINDMLMQARRQAENLQKELLEARRTRGGVHVTKGRLAIPEDEPQGTVIQGPPGGFAPTQPMSLPPEPPRR
jgi:hypothetical protein